MCADSLSITVTSMFSVEGLWCALTDERDSWWPELVLTPEVGSAVRETWTEGGREHFADGRVTEAVRRVGWPSCGSSRIGRRRSRSASTSVVTASGARSR
jgi:hypothetical protein